MVQAGTLVVGRRHGVQEADERLEVAVRGRGEALLDEVVAGDVDRVDPVHCRSVRAEGSPARGPGVEAGQVEEQPAGWLRVAPGRRAETAEEGRVVDVVVPHQHDEIPEQRRRHGFVHIGGQPELRSHAVRPGSASSGRERRERLGGQGDRLLLVVGQQREQGLGEPGQVPLRDDRLVAVGVAPAGVDRAEDRGGIEGLHERARAVVDRLAGDRHVVGVHHPVDESDEHPLGDQRCLRAATTARSSARYGCSASAASGWWRAMAWSASRRSRSGSPVARGVLERADAQVAARDPREHCSGQHGVSRAPIAPSRPRRASGW